MVVYKCKMCGGDIKADREQNIGTCPYCDSTMTLPSELDDRKANLFNRANYYRMQGDFDRALATYERILEDYGKDPEAHWGIVLCRYGIEYVEDPETGERKPTCHRTQTESILEDLDYQTALGLAMSDAHTLYEAEAQRIDSIHREILAISRNEKPFDIFICYKECDADGNRTQDSVLAQDIYDALTDKGLRTFFARITLEDKLGSAYEPYIFAALRSARVMIVVCTSTEHVNAVWVRNEWSRYFAMAKTDKSKTLIPVYKGMDAYDLPEALSSLQAQDAGRIGFMQDLVRGVEKLIRQPEPKQTAYLGNNAERLVDNAEAYMSMGNFDAALATCMKITQEYPRDPRGWWGLIRSSTRDLTVLEQQEKTEPWYKYLLSVSNNDPGSEIAAKYETYLLRSEKFARLKDVNDKIKSAEPGIELNGKELDDNKSKLIAYSAELSKLNREILDMEHNVENSDMLIKPLGIILIVFVIITAYLINYVHIEILTEIAIIVLLIDVCAMAGIALRLSEKKQAISDKRKRAEILEADITSRNGTVDEIEKRLSQLLTTQNMQKAEREQLESFLKMK